MTKSDLLSALKPKEREIYVKAWSATVKVRDISVQEYMQTHKDVLGGEVDTEKLLDAQIKTVAIAMIEPKLTIDELAGIDMQKMDGVVEIYETIANQGEEIPKT